MRCVPGTVVRPQYQTFWNCSIECHQDSVLHGSYGTPCHTWPGIMVPLPFLCETVLDAHQIGHSRLSWNVSDVSLPELICSLWTEEIPGLCSPSVFWGGKVQIVIFQGLPDSLSIDMDAGIPQFCPYSSVPVCWYFWCNDFESFFTGSIDPLESSLYTFNSMLSLL